MDRYCLPETKGESETKRGFPSRLRAEQQGQDEEQQKGNMHTSFYLQTHRPSSIQHPPVIHISPPRRRKESECLNRRSSSSDFNSQLEMSGVDPTDTTGKAKCNSLKHTRLSPLSPLPGKSTPVSPSSHSKIWSIPHLRD